MTKRVGILTSGGDCPGLNAAIRAVVSHATLTYGWDVLGIPYATQGLLEAKASHLTVHSQDLRGIDPLLSLGGTILGSVNKGDTAANADAIIAGYHKLGLDALIAIGGDGSLAILHDLAQKGNWNLVAIPKTIDNDVALTDRSIGFDTAVNTVTNALYNLSCTAASHDRVMVVEVMGRNSGQLALNSGLAGGADVILIPEIPYTIDSVCRKIRELRERWGRCFAIVVVAEGARTLEGEFVGDKDAEGNIRFHGIGEYIAEQISRCSQRNLEARVTVLGHVQRGGIPSALDRLLATTFGKAAVDLVAEGRFNRMVAWRHGELMSVPQTEVFALSPTSVDPDHFLVQTARALNIYIGELASDTVLEPVMAPSVIPPLMPHTELVP